VAKGSRGLCLGTIRRTYSAAESRVMEAVAHAQDSLNIPEGIFLAGFGCGGTMAFRIALNSPDVFAGALSLGGPFPLGSIH